MSTPEKEPIPTWFVEWANDEYGCRNGGEDMIRGAFDAYRHLSSQPSPALPWTSIEDSLPPNRKSVLGWDGKVVYVCNYYREHEEDVDCEDDNPNDDIESDEKNGCYWLKPGFWERLEQHGGYYDEISVKRKITHWMPMPPTPGMTLSAQLIEYTEVPEEKPDKPISLRDLLPTRASSVQPIEGEQK